MRALAHLIDDAAQAQAERSRRFPWQVTVHAAEQYRDRVDKTMTVTAAWRLLERCLPAAELLPQPTSRGQARWLLPGGDAVVVCKPDPKIRARVAVTVLGPHEMCEPEAAAEVVEAFDRTRAPVVIAPRPVSVPREAPPVVSPSAPRATPRPPAPRPTVKDHVPLSVHEDVKRTLGRELLRLQGAHASLLAQHAELRQRRDPDKEDLLRRLQSAEDRAAAATRRAKDAEDTLVRAAGDPDVLAEVAMKSITAGDLARARLHAENMDAIATRTKAMLRVAVVALRDGDCARGLRLLEAAQPGITGDHFCYPERFTKEERRAATMAAQQATGGVS